jgi:hypothetical protein
MKYYIYSYTWKTPRMSNPSVATGVSSTSTGIVGFYEYVVKQPEDWCLTHVAEITKDEYDIAERNGIIG